MDITITTPALLFPALSVAGNITPIHSSIRPNSITIIGETHQRQESIKLFNSLIKGYLKKIINALPLHWKFAAVSSQ